MPFSQCCLGNDIDPHKHFLFAPFVLHSDPTRPNHHDSTAQKKTVRLDAAAVSVAGASAAAVLGCNWKLAGGSTAMSQGYSFASHTHVQHALRLFWFQAADFNHVGFILHLVCRVTLHDDSCVCVCVCVGRSWKPKCKFDGHLLMSEKPFWSCRRPLYKYRLTITASISCSGSFLLQFLLCVTGSVSALTVVEGCRRRRRRRWPTSWLPNWLQSKLCHSPVHVRLYLPSL